MSTLAVVEAILREAAMPLSVREIVERAGDALPTKSKTPDTVVARDLSMDIKKKSDGSTFVRTSPGRYAIREQAQMQSPGPDAQDAQPIAPVATPVSAPAASIGGPAPSLADGPTSIVGQSLPHDRNGARPAPAKPTKPQSNSEDTPMSA
ncbi:MAG TPA: HTH domain-containing protein [Kofleriaceae bacterium]|nr:HTH domain-containing protein [Kofleriaceae bacterium]